MRRWTAQRFTKHAEHGKRTVNYLQTDRALEDLTMAERPGPWQMIETKICNVPRYEDAVTFSLTVKEPRKCGFVLGVL